MNNITCMIPCRSGSKGIVNKNIKDLGGKPLVAYTIECAQRAGIERVIVNTDGSEIAKIARSYGAEVMMRPEELGRDETSMYEVLNSEVPKINPIPEMVCLLQATVPFRKKVDITRAINLLVKHRDEYDSLISVEPVPTKYNPAQVIVTTPLGSRMASGAPISQRIRRRQEFPDSFIPTGSIYLFKTSNLEAGSIYGDKVFLMQTEPEINIDSDSDWGKAVLHLKNKQHG